VVHSLGAGALREYEVLWPTTSVFWDAELDDRDREALRSSSYRLNPTEIPREAEESRT
jgi:hypothetical protein